MAESRNKEIENYNSILINEKEDLIKDLSRFKSNNANLTKENENLSVNIPIIEKEKLNSLTNEYQAHMNSSEKTIDLLKEEIMKLKVEKPKLDRNIGTDVIETVNYEKLIKELNEKINDYFILIKEQQERIQGNDKLIIQLKLNNKTLEEKNLNDKRQWKKKKGVKNGFKIEIKG